MAVRTNTRRRGIRTFALVWSLITIVMGACTFFAIYTVYGVVNPGRNTITDTGSAALPIISRYQKAMIRRNLQLVGDVGLEPTTSTL